MSEPVLTRLRELAEPLVALSTSHLSPATRQLLQEDQLSVNAYPTLTGGFVYVGVPRYDTPLEADLARLFELAERAGIVWLKFDVHGATVEGMKKINPGYSLGIIPAGTYPKQTTEIKVPTFGAHIVVHCKQPEDLVYKMTKAIAENVAQIALVHKGMAKLTVAEMGVDDGVPMHAGALKYYKEKGISTK